MLSALCLSLPSLAAPSPLPSRIQEPIPVREVLAVGSLGEKRRSAVYTDALEAALARGTWSAPEEGDAVLSADGRERTWERVAAGEDGAFRGRAFRGGWAFARVEVPTGGPWRLDAAGHSFVLVDGEPHAGDVYSLGTTRVLLALAAGAHELLFRTGRGRLAATLEPAPAPGYLEEKDRTLPDVVRGEGGRLLLGQIVSNAGAAPASGWSIVAEAEGAPAVTTRVPPLLPSSLRKCAVELAVPADPPGDSLALRLELFDEEGELLHAATLSLAVRGLFERHARTFRSESDGSVQYYAVTPPPPDAPAGPKALVLTLHGAGVEGRGQAAAYAPKDWAYVVAATNRRPYGFDWEDWGRLDALEVLQLAQARYGTDPRRTYLTGHSMGGHGTWQVGAHFPDRFAAIAPSAGWRDFWSYAGGGTFPGDEPVGALLTRAANASRTELLERNYAHGGVYVLHGDADDNVPVREARAMRSRLAEFHPDFAYYERPGAGHWWGNGCVDWPPLFEFLRAHRLPEPAAVTAVEFTTVHPGISSRCDWVTVEAQRTWLAPSRVEARLDREQRAIELLAAENVARLALRPPLEPGPVEVRYRGAVIDMRYEDVLRLEAGTHDAGFPAAGAEPSPRAWFPAPDEEPSPQGKGPHRAGPFKDAWRHRMVFVYGTGGGQEERAWSLAKARYDHETWRYRGNGAVDVVADVDFDPARYADRGVVLYGNRDTNAAWATLLDRAPFDLTRGALRVGERTLEGDDLALLAAYPRRDSDVACVAVVGGTGLAGCRATDHLPYFVSGVGYPDWTVIGVEMLEQGLVGVRGAGFFDGDWSIGSDSAWR